MLWHQARDTEADHGTAGDLHSKAHPSIASGATHNMNKMLQEVAHLSFMRFSCDRSHAANLNHTIGTNPA